MARGFARIVLVGNLGGVPEMRKSSKGTPVANFSLAVNRRGPSGDDAVDWWRVTLWGQSADAAVNLLTKGSRVLIDGRPQIRQWETTSGEAKTTVEVNADGFELLAAPRQSTTQADDEQLDTVPF